MTFTFHPGWWLLPLAITLAAFGYAKYVMRGNQPSGDYGSAGLAEAFIFMAALIPSLIAWLIWALVR